MARPSILATMLAIASEKLGTLQAAYERQPDGSRRPTLPLTPDGKFNVRAFTVEVCGLPMSREQHFFKKAELTDLVNRHASIQGVKPIGDRKAAPGDGHHPADEDRCAEERLAKVRRERDDHARTLAEREAVIERLRRENAGLRERLRLVEETGMLVRGAPARC